jgi:RimJ/RimL family protein N-acetyltransferase
VVRIEPLAPSHAEGLFAALSDPAAYQFLDEAPFASPEAWRHRIATLARGSSDTDEIWLNWAVSLGSLVVGYTQATLSRSRGAADLAFVLAPSVWGLGVAHEACRQTIARIEGDHGMEAFVADTDVDNARAARLLGRLGFEETGVAGRDRHFRRPRRERLADGP